MLAWTVALPTQAWAEGEEPGSTGPEFAGYFLLGAADLALGIAGGVYAIGSWSHTARGQAPERSWLVGGYLTGGLNLAAGIGWLVIGLVDEDRPRELFFVAGTHVLIGALDIGLTLWSAVLPDTPLREVRIEPLLISDAAGRPAAGAGLRLVNW